MLDTSISVPEWFTLSSEQIAKARRLIAPEFWQADYPFDRPAYLDIGFPMAAGQITRRNIELIEDSSYYRDLERGIRRDKFEENWTVLFTDPGIFDKEELRTVKNTKVPEFAADTFRQFMVCDYLIYGQTNVEWKFIVDIANLRAPQRHRPDSDRHVDHFSLGLDGKIHPVLVKEMAEAFRSEKGVTVYPRETPMRGIYRNYSAATLKATEFDKRVFNPLDIVHYVAEPHISPRVAGMRIFAYGMAAPV